MYRMVQIVIAYGSPYRDPRALEPAMAAMSLDWARFAQTGWLLWTNRSIFEITERLKALLDMNDQFLVSAVSTSERTGGRLPQWIWDWINIERDPASGALSQQRSNIFASVQPPTPGLGGPDPRVWGNLFNHDPKKKP